MCLLLVILGICKCDEYVKLFRSTNIFDISVQTKFSIVCFLPFATFSFPLCVWMCTYASSDATKYFWKLIWSFNLKSILTLIQSCCSHLVSISWCELYNVFAILEIYVLEKTGTNPTRYTVILAQLRICYCDYEPAGNVSISNWGSCV